MGSPYRVSPLQTQTLQSISGPFAVGATLNRWIPMGAINSASMSTGGGAAGGHLRAFPVFFAQGHTFDRAGILVNTFVAASAVRIGLYADNGASYPGQLIHDLGEMDTSSNGAKTITGFTRTLSPGVLYWAAIWQSGNTVLRSVDSNGMWPLLGAAAALTAGLGVGWDVTKAYTVGVSTLPATFDAGGTALESGAGGAYPLWFARFTS